MTQRDWQKDMEMCEAATPGVWMADEVSRTWYGDRVGYFVMGEHFTDNNDGGIYGGGTFLRFEDAKFAAKAHAALPYWLQEAKELQEIVSGRGRELLRLRSLLGGLNDELTATEDHADAAEQRERQLKEAIEEALKWTWYHGEANMTEIDTVL
ncbi:MAG TPA: hypothetical protein DEA91_10015, partial [Paenibacillus sp.]|nr:hypothetical protein [Paenibacillus sp.]